MKLQDLSDAELEAELADRQWTYKQLRAEWERAARNLADAQAAHVRERQHVTISGAHRPDVAGCHDTATEHAEAELEVAQNDLEELRQERGGTHPQEYGSAEVAEVQREIQRRQAHQRLDAERDDINRRKAHVDRLTGVST